MASRKAAAAPARLARGRTREGATFPVAPPRAELPHGYAETLQAIRERIRTERVRAVLAANAAMVLLYWDIGRLILERQKLEGWGTKVIDRLAQDLSEAQPDMTGLSPRNLKYMRAFAEAWPDREFVQQAAAQIPWTQNCVILDRLDDPATRAWYVQATRENGWSRSILGLQIEQRAHERAGKAISNFDRVLPPGDSDLVAQVFKDPYLFDFLGTADPRREREVEQALVDHIQKFLLELGVGFAFVGRQVRLEVGDQDFVLDLLFYHLKLRAFRPRSSLRSSLGPAPGRRSAGLLRRPSGRRRRFVVVELKAVPFEPEFAGKLNFYLSAVDDLLRHPDDKPSIGLLLCKAKNKVVVEYALRDVAKPIGVAQWETRLVESLPEELKGSLPTVEEIEAEFGATS